MILLSCTRVEMENSRNSRGVTDFQQLWGSWTTLLNHIYDEPRVMCLQPCSLFFICFPFHQKIRGGDSLLEVCVPSQLTITAVSCLSLTGSTADEEQNRAVPQQPPFLSPDSVAVRRDGRAACWTFPHFCSRDLYYVCSGSCFL